MAGIGVCAGSRHSKVKRGRSMVRSGTSGLGRLGVGGGDSGGVVAVVVVTAVAVVVAAVAVLVTPRSVLPQTLKSCRRSIAG